MMERMDPATHAKRCRASSPLMRRLRCSSTLVLLGIVWVSLSTFALAQVSYVARFRLPKATFVQGEPAFCEFVIENTGPRSFAFSYRTPSRALNPELESEPRFRVTNESGRQVSDPAPRPCGGAKGTAVYGSVTLPPGQRHTERWLLNQWARFPGPGRYRVRAERRLPLLDVDPATQEFTGEPVAYALAINDLWFEITPSTQEQLEAAFRPYLEELDKSDAENLPEAVTVVTSLPRPFCLKQLMTLATASAQERRWDRQQALEGLARLGTPAAWEAISEIARGESRSPSSASAGAASLRDNALRSYAVLLLGQKGDKAFLPTLLGIASDTPDPELRGDVLRALGLFNDARANQVLFEKLRSAHTTDRVNAILGLKNLESKDAIPALLAMFKDPEAQVRQVAHFALLSLTGQKIELPPNASHADSTRVAEEWHAWWRNEGATFVPVRHPPCRDW